MAAKRKFAGNDLTTAVSRLGKSTTSQGFFFVDVVNAWVACIRYRVRLYREGERRERLKEDGCSDYTVDEEKLRAMTFTCQNGYHQGNLRDGRAKLNDSVFARYPLFYYQFIYFLLKSTIIPCFRVKLEIFKAPHIFPFTASRFPSSTEYSQKRFRSGKFFCR